MALEFQSIDVAAGPLDTGTDPTELQPGTLTIAENLTCQTPGVYEKRFGFDALAAGPDNIMRLFDRGGALNAIDGDRVWTYDTTVGAWRQGDTVSPAMTGADTVSRDQTTDLTQMTVATAHGLLAHAWIGLSGKVYLKLTNATDGSTVRAAAAIDNTTFNCIQMAAAGNFIVLFAAASATQVIEAVVIDCSTGTVGAPAVFANGANVSAARAVLDACPLDSTSVVVAYHTNTPNVKVAKVTASTGVASATQIVAAEAVDGPLTVLATTGEFGAILYHSTAAGGQRAACFNAATMVQTVAPFMMEAVVVPVGSICTLIRVSASEMMAVWSRTTLALPGGPGRGYTQARVFTSAGLGPAIANTLYSMELASKGWAYPLTSSSNRFFANVVYMGTRSALQETYFTVEFIVTAAPSTDFRLVATHAYRSAFGTTAPFTIPAVASPAAGRYVFDQRVSYKFLAQTTPRSGIDMYTVDFADPTRLLPCDTGSAVLLAAGQVIQFDGEHAVESNFAHYPEIMQATPGAVGAGGMDNGTYSYKVIFESSSANGDTTLSTPSIAVSAQTVAGAGLGKVTLTLEHLSLARLGALTTEQTGLIGIYRTTASGGTYFRIGSLRMDRYSLPQTYVDQAHDNTIQSNNQLYTTGGTLEREPPPSARHMIVHQGRVWGILASDPKIIFYSGYIVYGEAVWFSRSLQFRMDGEGDCTALASMDGKLLIFKENEIWSISGDGPSATGQNSTLTPPRAILTGVGCIDPRGISRLPMGIPFWSAKGLYMLTRGEEAVFLGQAVQGFTDDYVTISSAVLMEDRREVRFTLTGPVAPLADPAGLTLYYNYDSNRWTHNPIAGGLAMRSAALVGGHYYSATLAGIAYKESATSYLDAGSYVASTLEWGWLKPAGKQGLARIQSVTALNRTDADHGLEIQVAKDYSDIFTMGKTFGRTTLNALPREQVKVSLFDQQGEAFRPRVSDYQDGGTPGAGFACRGVALYGAPKRGAFKNLMQASAKG